MAWRTVQKDGAIEIYGSLFYYRGDAPYDISPGTKLWIVDGDQMDRIMAWKDQKRHDFRGIWGCATVWDEANMFHRPETKAQTRLRQLKDKAMDAIEEVRAALDDAEEVLETFPAERVDLTPVDAAMTEFEEKARAILEQPQIGAVTFLALFMAFDPSKDAPKHQLRTEAFTFGYPVYKGDISAQQTADTIIDEIVASYNSPVIRRMTAEEIAPFLHVGDDWSWDDADVEPHSTGSDDTLGAQSTPEQASGELTQ